MKELRRWPPIPRRHSDSELPACGAAGLRPPRGGWLDAAIAASSEAALGSLSGLGGHSWASGSSISRVFNGFAWTFQGARDRIRWTRRILMGSKASCSCLTILAFITGFFLACLPLVLTASSALLLRSIVVYLAPEHVFAAVEGSKSCRKEGIWGSFEGRQADLRLVSCLCYLHMASGRATYVRSWTGIRSSSYRARAQEKAHNLYTLYTMSYIGLGCLSYNI